MKVPSLLLISVAAAELAKGAQTSSQKSPQKSLPLWLAQMGRVGQKIKEESKTRNR